MLEQFLMTQFFLVTGAFLVTILYTLGKARGASEAREECRPDGAYRDRQATPGRGRNRLRTLRARRANYRVRGRR